MQSQISVLRETKKIKQFEKLSASLSKDRAPLQTSFYNNLKGLLKERLDLEEKDLYMKHFNDAASVILPECLWSSP